MHESEIGTSEKCSEASPRSDRRGEADANTILVWRITSTSTIDDFEVVGELAPLLLDLPVDLLPSFLQRASSPSRSLVLARRPAVTPQQDGISDFPLSPNVPGTDCNGGAEGSRSGCGRARRLQRPGPP